MMSAYKDYKFECPHCLDGDRLVCIQRALHTLNCTSAMLGPDGNIEDFYCEEDHDITPEEYWYECYNCQHKFTHQELIDQNLVTLTDNE